MRLIVISSSRTVENETEIVTQFFESGLKTFHLRKRRFSRGKTKQFINSIPKMYHDRIVLHYHHTLARKYNLKGIHLSKSHKKKQLKTWLILKFLRFSNPNIEVSTSYNNIGQLLEPNRTYKYSYVFLSPVFDSLSSKFQSGFTENSLRTALEKSEYKVIARGGVDVEAIEKAHRIGFEGLAFYSAIWKKKDATTEFLRAIEKYKSSNISIE